MLRKTTSKLLGIIAGATLGVGALASSVLSVYLHTRQGEVVNDSRPAWLVFQDGYTSRTNNIPPSPGQLYTWINTSPSDGTNYYVLGLGEGTRGSWNLAFGLEGTNWIESLDEASLIFSVSGPERFYMGDREITNGITLPVNLTPENPNGNVQVSTEQGDFGEGTIVKFR